MAELWVRIKDRYGLPGVPLERAGQVISVEVDRHPWTPHERNHPEFRIVKVKGKPEKLGSLATCRAPGDPIQVLAVEDLLARMGERQTISLTPADLRGLLVIR